MNSAGNAGSQSATLIIRGLALDEIKLHDILKVIWKEFRVSLIVGVILSAVNFAKIYFIDKAGVLIALTVSLSLSITIILAKIVGGSFRLSPRNSDLILRYGGSADYNNRIPLH